MPEKMNEVMELLHSVCLFSSNRWFSWCKGI